MSTQRSTHHVHASPCLIPSAAAVETISTLSNPILNGRPPLFLPLQEILYFHQAIRSALHSFAAETRALQGAEGGVTPPQLQALVERHRFIRAVCLFHSASEDEVRCSPYLLLPYYYAVGSYCCG